MPITIIDESRISWAHLEDRQVAQWEADKAHKTGEVYGDALQRAAPGQDISISGNGVHITVATDQDPIAIARAACLVLRDGMEYRQALPCDWHVGHIREQYRNGEGSERVYEIALNDNTHPGDQYREDEKYLKKHVGL